MAQNVPVLYQDIDTPIHHRDPRVKVLLFFLLFIFLFIAPTWQWMLVPTILGLVIAMIARTSWKWLAVLWLIHLPTFIVLILIPTFSDLIAGDYGAALEAVTTHLRLILAWSAAIFVSVSLFSTIEPNELKNGLLGLGVPPVIAFAIGLSYRLLYVTLSEIFQIADAMRLKGVELDWKKPFRFIWNSLRLSLPVLFTVLRRGPTLMAVMDMRGYSKSSNLGGLDLADILMLACGVLILGLAAAERFGLIPALTTGFGLV